MRRYCKETKMDDFFFSNRHIFLQLINFIDFITNLSNFTEIIALINIIKRKIYLKEKKSTQPWT